MPWYTETRPLRRSLPSTWRSWPQPTLRHNSNFYPSGGYVVWKSMGPVFPVWLTLIDSNLDDCRLMMWPAGDLASWHSSESSASRRLFQPEGCGRLLVMLDCDLFSFQRWAHWSDFMFCTHLFHVWFYPGRCYRGGVLRKVFNDLNTARIHFLNQYFCLKQDTLDKLNSRYVSCFLTQFWFSSKFAF